MFIVLSSIGLIFGSFVNALVWRLHEQERTARSRQGKRPAMQDAQTARDLSILTGRSMCTSCHHLLAARDLVPVMSWVLLRGRCRYCHAPIALQYPLVELLTAVLFAVSFVWWPAGFGAGGWVAFVLWLACVTLFMALAVYDLRWFLLPDRIVFPLIALAVAEVAARAALSGGGWQALAAAVGGAAILAGLFYTLHQLSSGAWIGFGDVKLAVALGLLAGGPLPALLLLFIASLLGSLVAVPLLIRGKATAATHVPFGPFLLAATMCVALFGGSLLAWYGSLLHM